MSVTGPNGYTFSNAAAGATQSLSNLCAGTYSATFTDGQCTATSSFVTQKQKA